MHSESQVIKKVAEALTQRLGDAPPTALVLGSGLGRVARDLADRQAVPYGEVGLPEGTVHGHASELVVGRMGAARVAVCSGRIHMYEGRPAADVVRGVRSLIQWGCKRVILTCSVGGIRDDLIPGRLVLVTDHMNFQRTNPLVGEAMGTRFPDLSRAYDPDLRALLAQGAQAADVQLAEGILACMNGPAYETPAEVRMLRTLGADIVGMSTVPEILALAEVGAQAAVVAVVSNRAAGLSSQSLTHDEVTEASGIAAASLIATLEQTLCKLDDA